MAVLLDTHVVHWWSIEPARLSHAAAGAIANADELAWLAQHGRIVMTLPIRSWLDGLAGQLRTLEVTPAVAATAVALPSSFPGDPADRLIYATAIEHGWPLVTRDERLRRHRHPRRITVW